MWRTRTPPPCSSLPLSLFSFFPPQLAAAEKSAELCNFIHVEQGKKGMKNRVGAGVSFAANHW